METTITTSDIAASDAATSDIATCDERIIKIEGPVASGKTQSLLERCLHLLKNSAAPETILVTTATSAGAHAFASRLCAASSMASPTLAEKAARIRVCTALDIIIDTLSKPEIVAITGRSARLLAPFEYNFLLEDMKTLGQPRRELRAMLRYFYRNWAQLTPESEWLYGDSVSVCTKLQDMCTALGAVSEFEAPYLCANFLKSSEGEDFRGAFDYVLCDDFQNLSHAEQTALCLHAKKQLIVAGDMNQHNKTGSAFVHTEGFEKFDTLRHHVRVFSLTRAFGNSSIQNIAHALCETASESAPIESKDTPVCRVKWRDPEEEIIGMTKIVRHHCDGRESNAEHNCCIVVPNKRFGLLYKKALEARGFRVSLAGLGNHLNSDPRNTNAQRSLQAYLTLNLITHPNDAVAWRAWCGIGNALCNSQAFEGMYAYLSNHDLTLPRALEYITAAYHAEKPEPFLRAYVLAKRYEQGLQAIREHGARRGFSLLRALGVQDAPEFADVAQNLAGNESAQEMFELVRTSMFSPSLSDDPHTLNIVTYASMAGLNFETIFVVSMVDGYMPNRNAFEVVSTEADRTAAMNAERRACYATLGKAHNKLVLSYFTQCDLELAERTKMQVSRIRSEQGCRVASSRPSCFFTTMEQACPHTVSGQELLSQLNVR